MTNQSNIESIVMRRVYIMRVLRILFSNISLAFLVSGLALWGIGREVWVARVFQNAPADLTSDLQFYLYAFIHTRFVVQALALITFAGIVTLARETARSIAGSFALTHVQL